MLRVTLLVIIGVAFLLNGMACAGSTTFANSGKVSSKQSDGKTTATMPDTCLSPPSSPGGPVPVPYPNTSSASDTQKGSKKVKMSGKEIMLKGEKLKKSAGDEAGTSTGRSLQNRQTERYRRTSPKILKKSRQP